jgi:hypothetical protein
MIRYYCDGCGKEMSKAEKNVTDHRDGGVLRMTHKDHLAIKVTVTALVGSTANSGHLCVACARKIISEGYEVAK